VNAKRWGNGLGNLGETAKLGRERTGKIVVVGEEFITSSAFNRNQEVFRKH
jgi:hypothetical protein